MDEINKCVEEAEGTKEGRRGSVGWRLNEKGRVKKCGQMMSVVFSSQEASVPISYEPDHPLFLVRGKWDRKV